MFYDKSEFYVLENQSTNDKSENGSLKSLEKPEKTDKYLTNKILKLFWRKLTYRQTVNKPCSV